MHQTTVRIGDDLRLALERETARLGVSVGHHLHEPTLVRLACTDGAGNGGEAVCPLAEQRAGPQARSARRL